MSGEGPKFIIENQQIRSLEGLVTKRLSYAEMAILIALVDAKGNAVSRDTLMTLGWPGKIVVANSLNMAILSLRRILRALEIGDVVVTIPKVGFRIEKYYLFSYINDSLCEAQDDNNSNEPLSKVDRETALDNHGSSMREEREKRIEIAKPRSYHVLILKSVLILLLFVDLFLFLQLSSHKPKLTCEMVMDGVQVCARDIDSDMLNAARRHLSILSIRKPALIWSERNPHQGDGFKFYIVGEPEHVR